MIPWENKMLTVRETACPGRQAFITAAIDKPAQP